MKRTREEIKTIADEIKVAVTKTIFEEEMKVSYIPGRDEIMMYHPIWGWFRTDKQMVESQVRLRVDLEKRYGTI